MISILSDRLTNQLNKQNKYKKPATTVLKIMITMRQISSPYFKEIINAQKGFTLVESLVAMLILLGTLGGLVPVFMSYRLGAIDNQIKTGAIAVAQAELEEIRQTDFRYLPTVNTPVVENSTADFMGKTYDKVTTYCLASGPTCDTDTKAVHVEVRYNNRQILEIETVYTSLDFSGS